MKPSVARMVHYTSLGDRDGRYPPDVIAAVMTKVIEIGAAEEAPMQEEARYRVSLKAFYPSGLFDMPDVKFTTEPAGSEGARGKWGWPVRE